jgi:uncharacterized membrane protein YvlD (DUF360 family)
MNDVLYSFLILACSFWVTAQILSGVQLEGWKGAGMAAALFGAVNALIGWFMIGVVVVAPLGVVYLLLFGTRWLVNGLLLVLLATSAKILIIRNSATAFGAGLVITGIGTIGEYFLLHRP